MDNSHGPSSIVYELGESGWESNPPRPATRPATGFEDQEAHRDLTTPNGKDNRMIRGLQVRLSVRINLERGIFRIRMDLFPRLSNELDNIWISQNPGCN